MSEAETLRALYLPYDRVHFLLNRTQCSSSLFVSGTRAESSSYRYLRESLEVDGTRLHLFDLDLFLREVFRLPSGGKAQLAVVAELSGYAVATRELFEDGIIPRLEASVPSRVAFRLPSSTVMSSLSPVDLLAHNLSLRNLLVRHGFLALHPFADSMGFLVDLDRLIGSGALLVAASETGVAA